MERHTTQTVRDRRRGWGPPTRRWLRFGPGLALALIAIALLWPHLPGQGGARPYGRIQPGTRGAGGRVDAPPDPPPTAPDPAWLLEQKTALGLNPAQVQKLTRLRRRWDRDTQALREGLTRASGAFNRSMEGRDRGRVTMQELQERAAPVSELSRQLSAVRRAWWDEAADALTPAQRQKAEQAWAGRFTRPPRRGGAWRGTREIAKELPKGGVR